MLIAALVIAGNTIDYQTVAKPLAAVLKDLTVLTGLEMRASDALADEKLVIRVKDVELAMLRERIAEAVCGQWAKQNGPLVLSPDLKARRARQDEFTSARIERIRERLKLWSEEPATSLENMAKYHSTSHTSRAAAEIVGQMNLALFTNIEKNTRRVFSTNATRRQIRIGGAENSLRRAVAEHNRLAEIAESLEVDEPIVGSGLYQSRRRLLRKWTDTTILQLECWASEETTSVGARFLDDREIVGSTYLYFDWKRNGPIEIPSTAKPDALIGFSKRSIGMARLMAVDEQQVSMTIPEESVAELKTPTSIDPLSLCYSEMLSQIGEHTGWQVVALVRDEMAPQIPSAKLTLKAAVDAVTSNMSTRLSLSNGWLLLSPSAPEAAQQIDRQELERFIDKCAAGLPTLDVFAELAAACPDPIDTPLLTAYLHAFCGRKYNFGNSPDNLRFYDALSTGQRSVVRNGGVIIVGDLTPNAKSILETILFDRHRPRISDIETSNPASINTDLRTDPTDNLPNGLLPQMRIQFRVSKSYGLLPVGQSENDLPIAPFTLNMLYYWSGERFGTPPRHPNFRLGDHLRITLEMPISERLRLVESLNEYKIDRKSPIYQMDTAPSAFKDAYNAMMKKRSGG